MIERPSTRDLCGRDTHGGRGFARRDHRGSAVSLVVVLGQAWPCALGPGPGDCRSEDLEREIVSLEQRRGQCEALSRFAPGGRGPRPGLWCPQDGPAGGLGPQPEAACAVSSQLSS